MGAYESAMNFLSPEQTRNIYLLLATLSIAARDAEHAAFILHNEQLTHNNTQAVADYNAATRYHLNVVREQLAAIRVVMNQDLKQTNGIGDQHGK